MTDEDWGAAVVLLLVMVLVVGGCSVFVYGKLATYDHRVSVTSLTWLRTQPVEVFKAVHEDTLRIWMPADAYDISYYTDCDDDGDCDNRARYTVNRWRWDHNLTTTGKITEERVWPVFIPDTGEWLGAKRATPRYETLFVNFVTPEQRAVVYTASDETDWRTYLAGQGFAIQFNRFEEPLWDTLRLLDQR
jgi:hypothetical protein